MSSEALLELARERFRDDWTDADETLFRQTGSGEVADFGKGDPAEADKWGKDRVLRADRIVWLCTDRDAVKEVTHKGVHVKGARIEGHVDLSYVKIGFPLAILNSAIREGIMIQQAHLAALFLNGTHASGIEADRLRVEHGLFMRDGFQAMGEVRLLGAKISGTLDCRKGQFSNPNGKALNADGVDVKGTVFLNDGFQATGEVRLLGATIGRSLDCVKGHFSNPDGHALSADGVEVVGSVFLRDGFQATGEVRLLGAKIGGDLSCIKGCFSNPKGHAFYADGVEVRGSVFFGDGFQATGEVCLLDAKIGGILSCTKGCFSNPNGKALSADGVEVVRGVFLSDGFQATGEVRLLGAKIGGNLECDKGCFSNPKGYALNADGVGVAGTVFLRNGFQATGEVRLPGATIGSNLECDKGHFTNPHKDALSADGVGVAGSVFLRNGFQSTGEVRLLGAKIGGNLDCSHGRFNNPDGDALNANGLKVEGSVFLRGQFQAEGIVDFMAATVKRYFHWRGIEGADRCTLRLTSAKIGTLWDEEASWPAKLYLDGLVYDRLYSDAPLGWKERLKWLGLQGYDEFVPQPYVQLANVLKEMGHEVDARRILIAKQEDPARVRNLTIPRRAGHIVLGATIGYGYRPWRAGWWIAGFIVLGWFLFWIGSQQGLLAETKEGMVPAFNAFVYSLDAFVPLIDLHQEKYRLPTGWFLRGYHWIHISLGWVLTTLLVVGLTGLVRR